MAVIEMPRVPESMIEARKEMLKAHSESMIPFVESGGNHPQLPQWVLQQNYIVKKLNWLCEEFE